MATELIYIYSSGSQEKLFAMMEEFFTAFDIIDVQPSDIFYTGVFCKPETYSNYPDWQDAPDYAEAPEELTTYCMSSEDRLAYVKDVMKKVMNADIKKPEWMIWLEMNYQCDDYDSSPSTFLYLQPKAEKYSFLATAILDFLYSPNVNATLFNPVIL